MRWIAPTLQGSANFHFQTLGSEAGLTTQPHDHALDAGGRLMRTAVPDGASVRPARTA